MLILVFFQPKPFYNLITFFAVVTIFFAVKLAKAELPSWFDWILVAFVAFHVLVHLVLSVSFAFVQIHGDF